MSKSNYKPSEKKIRGKVYLIAQRIGDITKTFADLTPEEQQICLEHVDELIPGKLIRLYNALFEYNNMPE